MAWHYEWIWEGWNVSFGYSLREWGIGIQTSFEWCHLSFELTLGPLYFEIGYWR